MKKVTLLNVYGTKNIGDEAIYNVALSTISSVLKEGIIYSIGVEKRKNFSIGSVQVRYILSPYGNAINQGGKVSSIGKLIKFFYIFVTNLILSFIIKLFPKLKLASENYEYIDALNDSDFVANMGGGYLRTKEQITDFFGLGLTLLPIYIAKLFNKPQLFLPMSFGNFASDIHKNISLHAISGSIFIARDKISYKEIADTNNFSELNIDLKLLPDLALLMDELKVLPTEQKMKSKYIVLSARDWMASDKQQRYEKILAQFVDTVYEQYQLKTVFVAMAANSLEDDDRKPYGRIRKMIKNKQSFSLSDAATPDEVIEVLDKAKASVCTRMHLAILSSKTYTPFIAIQYEHKTLGFMKSLGLTENNINIDGIEFETLMTKFSELISLKKYKEISTILKNRNDVYKEKRTELDHCLGDFFQV